MPTRQQVIRTIASSLAFDSEPAYIRSLDRARQAGADITDALIDAGVLPAEFSATAADPAHTPDGQTLAEFTKPNAS